MTPAELHGDLVETARWWASDPLFSERARKWVAFYEQLPGDEPLLVVSVHESGTLDQTFTEQEPA